MRTITRLFLFIGIPIIVAILAYGFLSRAFLRAVDAKNTSVVLVEIPQGSSFKDITRLIKERDVVRHAWALEILARVRKVDTDISAGEYEFSPSMTPLEILNKLIKGEVLKRRVVIPEGKSIWEYGTLLEQAQLLPQSVFDPALTDRRLLIAAGINADSFEGYLFPNTYEFSKPVTPKQIIWQMLEEGEKRWTPEVSANADALMLSRHEVITLASIIEKETGKFEEQATISSVFHNRLKQGMKLQSDPTVIYGIKNFNGNLTKTDLETDHPYNTYTRWGLPPGPICNPGESAIKAAVEPAQTSYLYFVADGMGGHIFSATLEEHNEAVNRYQRGRGAAPQPAP
ncbi:MAG: endolytic transglycosylase MltG [Bdellovibrionota bacterium]|nr:MAG: endolytic transglycosylase MltG [Bdellovibrionota bacterium]